MKILALMILVFVGSNSFASASCESLFDKTTPSLQEIDSVIIELHSLRQKALTSSSGESRIANILFKQKFSELSHFLSESEIQKRLKAVKFEINKRPPELSEKEKETINLVKVQKFLQEIQIPIDGKDTADRTPLHWAVIKNRLDLISPLMFLGNDINVKTHNDDSLVLAIRYNRPEIAEILIRSGANITPERIGSESHLRKAAMNGRTEIVEMLCMEGACAETKELNAALYLAATLNHKEVVKTLIKFGADVNDKPVIGQSLLSIIQGTPHTEIVEILKNAGAKE
jgi:ankyrin repeat protein